MIFAIDPTMKRLVATIPRGDRIAEFDCVPDTCRNPACRCLTMTVTFRARTLDDPARPAPSSEPTVGVDLGTRMLDGKFRISASPSDLAFAEGLLGAMEPADFDLLRHIHFMIKSRETELAKPTEIKAQFDFQEIERSSVMQTYNDILPFAETMSVVVDGIEYVVLDQYCVRPGCRCKDVHLNLLPITEGRALETTGVVSVDYATKAWMRVEDEPLPCDVATIKGLIEGAIPDFYGKLPARHDKLRAIYANCRKRWRAAVADVIIKEPAGRNDPCPCGSGKKFKRCCMGKATREAPICRTESSVIIRR